MKRVVLIALTVILSSTAFAGLESSIFASYLDSKDLGDAYGAGLKTEFNLFKWLGIDTRVSYLDYKVGDTYSIPLEASAVVNIPFADSKFNPYGGIGVGYYIMDSKIASLSNSTGYYPFIGLKAGTKSLAFMAEARWLFLETNLSNASQELTGKSEAKSSGLGVNLGLVIRW